MNDSKTDGVMVDAPAAWMHEFKDPHTGDRSREPRLHKPADYELQPGDTVRPLVYADGVLVDGEDGLSRVAQVISDFTDLSWGDCKELAGRIAGVAGTFHCRKPAIGPACETQCERCADEERERNAGVNPVDGGKTNG